MNLSDSIEILQRLEARADESQRRYAIELMAYLDVRDGLRRNLADGSWQRWYDTAYAEATLKRDVQS